MKPAFGPSLRKKVILIVVINQTIEVINPSFLLHAGIEPIHRPLAGGEVILRTQSFLVKRPGRHRQSLRIIGLNNLILVDVSPVTTCLVHDLHLCLLAKKSPDIPTGWHQAVASPAGRAFYDFAIEEQVYAGVALVIAATDEK